MAAETTDYERGKREGILYCANELRGFAFVSKDEIAEAFRDLAEGWEQGRKRAPGCPHIDDGA